MTVEKVFWAIVAALLFYGALRLSAYLDDNEFDDDEEIRIT